jgi:hypothetical protein
MKELNFRPLKANEIECRVGNVAKSGNGFFLLLYKNARVDQTILDETLGAYNWQCKYYQVKNTMVCSVGIYNEERNEWIWKDNGGDDDFNAEQIKAELSDSFKRACFCLGIGRELYYSPKIWVNIDNGKNDAKDHYSVKNIEYDANKRITNLIIVNDKTKEVVFLYGKTTKVAENGDLTPKNDIPNVDETKGSIDMNDLEIIRSYVAQFTRQESRDKFFAHLEKKYGAKTIEELTLTQGQEVRALFEGKK